MLRNKFIKLKNNIGTENIILETFIIIKMFLFFIIIC